MPSSKNPAAFAALAPVLTNTNGFRATAGCDLCDASAGAADAGRAQGMVVRALLGGVNRIPNALILRQWVLNLDGATFIGGDGKPCTDPDVGSDHSRHRNCPSRSSDYFPGIVRITI